ncbi:magnesium transporter [Streptomyces sp. NPDC048504]|uniref:magnesium transporter n=1 Tax=Streptomyces sp. NPDC048504 TaxID=3365559 RepID=UPI003720E561
MFPGLLEEFEAGGVPVVREPTEMYFAPGGHLLCQEGRYADPTPIYQPTRSQLEGQIRARVRELPGVEIIDRCEAAGLLGASDGSRVAGVRVVECEGGAERELTADLVVDATGRGGRATRWLADLSGPVAQLSDTEDVVLQSGAAPWMGHYMAASVWQLARYRVVWLLLLLLAATLTVTVTEAFESTLEKATQLAMFIPLLIGTGGNAGAQAATAAIRALAVGEVRVSDLPAVIWRECRVDVVLGTMLATLGMVLGTLFVGAQIAVVVGITLVIICGWAATVGGAMPLLAKRLHIDPAVVSAPMVTTLVDATGLVIYFLTARTVLGI